MTDRHLAALSLLTHGAATGGEPCGSYYDQHLSTAAETSTSRQSAAYHFHAQQQQQQQQQQHALQQRLLYQQQQRYHAAAYQQHAHSMVGYSHPYSTHYNHLPVRDTMPINNYLSHQQSMHAGHYDGTYHGRLMGGAAVDMIAHSRTRFSPYHHQKHQSFHASSMYSAAGHQLLPSSVLHYPPRTSAYLSMQQQKREQEQYNQTSYEQQIQQQQRAYLQNLHGTDSVPTSGAYNPYSISQHHYQQSQLSMLSTQQQQQQQQRQHQQQLHLSRCSTPAANITNLPNHPQGMHRTIELPTRTNLDQEPSPAAATIGANYEDIHGYSSNNNHNSESLYQHQHQQRHQQQVQQQFRDCLTTSPPLISGSGTDSGISSSSGCSTRGGNRGSDSTQSTPVYSGEYPMSVGSSSGVSYHYVDSVREQETESKDIKEELPLMMMGSKDGLEKTLDVKHEANENESDFHCNIKKEPLDEGCYDGKPEEYNPSSSRTEELESFGVHYKNNTSTTTQAESTVMNHQQMEWPVNPLSSTTSASGIQTNSSPNIRDRCATPFIQAPTSTSHAFQQKQLDQHQLQQNRQQQQKENPKMLQQEQQQQQHYPQLENSTAVHQTYKKNNNQSSSSWSPFPSSPNTWLNRYSPICEFTNRDQESPLQVPVPPHNSPVDFEPSTALPSLPFFTPTTGNNRNRIKESDFKTLKKLRKKPVEIKVELEESRAEANRQHLTPLPGFQQTFGSTEIGRFSETFSLTPDSVLEPYASYDENSPNLDYVAATENTPEQYGSRSYTGWKCENEYYTDNVDNSNRHQYNMCYNGVGQRYTGGIGLDYEAAQYGVRSAINLSRSSGGYNEIRCNGN